MKEKALIMGSLVFILSKQLSTHYMCESLLFLISFRAFVAVNSNGSVIKYLKKIEKN